MYKIRTMRLDAEAETGPVWAKANDPRITRLGRFLRKLHLDELPQLINVVKKEMSLIGPRPERPEIAAVLAEDIPGYTDRLVVLPGVTGLAQINLPPDSTLDDVRRKLVLDMKYIKQAGPWLDARILMSTFARMVGVPGEWAMTTFRAAMCLKFTAATVMPRREPSGNGEVSAATDDNGNGQPSDARQTEMAEATTRSRPAPPSRTLNAVHKPR